MNVVAFIVKIKNPMVRNQLTSRTCSWRRKGLIYWFIDQSITANFQLAYHGVQLAKKFTMELT
jgi:hypothetical protein